MKGFRLRQETLEGLQIASRRNGMTENSFVEKVLTRRIRVDSLLQAFESLTIGKETFVSILGMTNVNGMDILASEQGKKSFLLAKQLFESNGIDLTFFRYVTEILGEQAGWFTVEGAQVKPEVLTLYHSCGRKWSRFLKEYLASAFELASHEKLKVELGDEFVTVRIPPNWIPT